MKTSIFKYFILVLTIGFFSGCNPFGKNSFIDIRDSIFSQPTRFEMNNGGTNTSTNPISGQPSDIHKVTYKVGSVYKQNQKYTADGHGFFVTPVSK